MKSNQDEVKVEATTPPRRKKKKKVSKFRFYFLNFLLGIIIVVIAGAMIIGMFCTVKEVKVSGTDLYTPIEIQNLVLNKPHDNNTIYAFFRNKIQDPPEIEFIQDVEVSLVSYEQLAIVVKEKKYVAAMPQQIGEQIFFIYFDGQGKIVEISQRFVEPSIIVEGTACEEPKVGKTMKLPKGQVSYLTKALQMLEEEKISVQKVVINQDNHMAFVSNGVTVQLGGKSKLEEKIERVAQILPELEGKIGVLHLENWNETNTDIVFRYL